MRPQEHDLNSLRGIIRKLQDENSSLKKLLVENGILYETEEVINSTDVPDEYDEDQGGRIIPITPNLAMAKEFYGFFWGRTDVFAKRGKNGGYFPQCESR